MFESLRVALRHFFESPGVVFFLPPLLVSFIVALAVETLLDATRRKKAAEAEPAAATETPKVETDDANAAFPRNALSVPHITAAGFGLAVAYNVGFFWVIGIDFMSLFSIQEHIVFAVSGLIYVVIFLAAVGFVDAAYSDVKRANGRVILSAAAIFLPTYWGWNHAVSSFKDAGWQTAACVVVIYLLALVLLLILRVPRKNAAGWFIAGCVVVIAAVAIGAYGGNNAVRSKVRHEWNWAVTASGQRLGIVRIGSENSLLVDDSKVVRVVRTNRLIEIAANKGAKQTPKSTP